MPGRHRGVAYSRLVPVLAAAVAELAASSEAQSQEHEAAQVDLANRLAAAEARATAAEAAAIAAQAAVASALARLTALEGAI